VQTSSSLPDICDLLDIEQLISVAPASDRSQTGGIKPGRITMTRALLATLSSIIWWATLPVFAVAAPADEITLGFPVRCELGVNCFFQNYVDHDATGKVRDYRCGGRTYDGHNGTDIRIPDLNTQRRGVQVLASAAGDVTAVRDGIDDVSVRTIGRAAVTGKECGNGVVIEHKNGWKTQYCHMAKGSVRVKIGDRVAAGDPIGLVGLSGDTEFPHLHLTVRLQNKIVDPFAHEASPDACGGGHSIWAESIRTQTQYRPRDVLNYGFSDLPPTMELVESGELPKHPVTSHSDALVAYVRAIGLQEGDQQALTLHGPDGAVLSEYTAPVLERDKAQYFVATGRKHKLPGWEQGVYTASYLVRRNDEDLLRKVFEIRLGPP
jgi:murein DD-endopeptidase MepM/ murein hydrolase activator NlpD